MLYLYICIVLRYIGSRRYRYIHFITVCVITVNFANGITTVFQTINFVCMRSVFVCAVNFHRIVSKKLFHSGFIGAFGFTGNRICGLTSYRIRHRRLVTRNGPRTIDIQKRDALLTLRIRIQHVAKKGFVVLVHICLRIRYSYVTGVSVCGITCKLTDFKSSIDQTVNAVAMLNFSVCAVDFNSVFSQQTGIRIGEIIWFWYCYSI